MTTGGFFNTTSGRFRAPVDGLYVISAFVRCETQGCDITLRYNGYFESKFNNIFSEALNCYRTNFDLAAGFGTDLVDQIEGNAGNLGAVW